MLGASETVNAKMRFDDWLWEIAHACVKHYHSDNVIGMAEVFCDSCQEEKQMQSFSGVGAQHQSA